MNNGKQIGKSFHNSFIYVITHKTSHEIRSLPPSGLYRMNLRDPWFHGMQCTVAFYWRLRQINGYIVIPTNYNG